MTKHYICSRYPGTDYYEFEAALPAMQPGDSVRVTLKADGRFDVVLVRPSAAAREAWGAEMWVDACEQENDR